MSGALDLRELARSGPVHFVGIAGAGMSALAELVLRTGGQATGCDARPGEVADALRELGADIHVGHDPAHVQDAVAVVRTSAVPADHPEIRAAHERGIPVLKRAAALGALVNAGTVVAVAGTHGKTTTTALTTAILEEAGLDPTAFVGGHVPGWTGGLRAGGAGLFVVEADEYDRSFLTLEPDLAAVTSLEADHLDVYGSVEALEDGFAEFFARVPEDGLVAGCVDDAGARRLLQRVAPRKRVAYGLGEAATLRATSLEPRGRGTRFTIVEDGASLGPVELAAPGRHNVQNALAAFALARHVGADLDAARRAFARFAGVGRRFEELGEAGGIVVVNDYAHHPTEIRATLEAARARFPERRLVALFQPHLYSRTRDLHPEFGAALAGADLTVVTDVYPAREAPIAGVDGELVVRAAKAAGAGRVVYEARIEALAGAAAALCERGDVALFMGAGDIDGAAREFFRSLRNGEEAA